MVKGVDEVFLEESLELKKQYLLEHSSLMVIGDDWKVSSTTVKHLRSVIPSPHTCNIDNGHN